MYLLTLIMFGLRSADQLFEKFLSEPEIELVILSTQKEKSGVSNKTWPQHM